MDETKTENHVRKTIALTHKQAGISAASIATLAAMLAGPLGGFFQSKSDGANQAVQISELKAAVAQSKTDIIAKIEDVVKPIAHNVDKLETRVVFLEQIKMEKEKTR